MTVFEWLNTKINDKETVLQRYCFLINLNHGFMGVKGKTGLRNLQEIVDLEGMSGCLDGFMKACDGKHWDEVQKMLELETKRQLDLEKNDTSSAVHQALAPRGALPHGFDR